MKTAEVFWSGRSQAVRLPKSFRFTSSKVAIRREGHAVIALLEGQLILSRRVRQHRATSFGLPAPVLHELFHRPFESRNVAANLA